MLMSRSAIAISATTLTVTNDDNFITVAVLDVNLKAFHGKATDIYPTFRTSQVSHHGFSGNGELGIGNGLPIFSKPSIKSYFIPRSNSEKTSTSQLRVRNVGFTTIPKVERDKNLLNPAIATSSLSHPSASTRSGHCITHSPAASAQTHLTERSWVCLA